MQVQEEMIRRANFHSGQDRKKRVYSSKYALSSIVYCSKCGDIYRRIAWNNRGKHSIVWRCCTRVEHGPGACDADTIQESELQNLTVRAINMALGKKETMSEVLQKNVEAVLTGADGIPLDEIDSRLEQLQKNHFDELGIKKLPSVKSLREEYTDLLEQKRKAYSAYKQAKNDMKELHNVRVNVEYLLEISSPPQPQRSTEKSRQ